MAPTFRFVNEKFNLDDDKLFRFLLKTCKGKKNKNKKPLLLLSVLKKIAEVGKQNLNIYFF